MSEINQRVYETSRYYLTKVGLPEYVVDAASRIVASDDPNKPNLGRNEVDNEICKIVAEKLGMDKL
jgi:hypothetical protein